MVNETYEAIEEIIIEIYTDGEEGNTFNYLYEATKQIKEMLPECPEERIREVLIEAYDTGDWVREARNHTIYEEDVHTMDEGDREELICKLMKGGN